MWESAALLQKIGNASAFIALFATVIAAVAGTVGSFASNRATDLNAIANKKENDLTTRSANLLIAAANAKAQEAIAEAARANEAVELQKVSNKDFSF